MNPPIWPDPQFYIGQRVAIRFGPSGRGKTLHWHRTGEITGISAKGRIAISGLSGFFDENGRGLGLARDYEITTDAEIIKQVEEQVAGRKSMALQATIELEARRATNSYQLAELITSLGCLTAAELAAKIKEKLAPGEVDETKSLLSLL